ncbi:M28 family metallopeptidase [Fulvivirgaceae bacterium BMA10]|uniref:M28 family metallopeptidase n=1 Tax=Splendidivirga corallicola TaxID=3051826 RepID=A0ABT8KZQ8_9BACT|nr:M28 family metallopeptidase [Fulvivirgaceae bacterium BMA10]
MMMKSLYYSFILICGLVIVGCQPNEKAKDPAESITKEDLARRISKLASDEFEGRKPFTNGEIATINYIKEEFEKMGIKPGNGDSYFQEVPLVEIEATITEDMKISGGKDPLNLKFKEEFVALTRRVQDAIDIENSEMVFAGFGVVAPEYNWNDYEGLDVQGKTVVVLVNDPGFGTGDDDFFKGEAMTYYGRWTYKYEEAARQGAEAILIIHDTEPASYPWQVVEGGWTGANLYLKADDNNMSRCAAEGWISLAAAKKIFANAGYKDYDFTAEARKRDFKAFSLNQQMSLGLTNTINTSTSNNVVGLYEGGERADECIIYSAHWDHFGIGAPNAEGDSIYNGAVDNATGVANIIELAEAFTKLEQKTKRSVLFIAVTAEEQGLLGSAYYAANPIFPAEKTAANLNTDAIIPMGKVKDLTIIGYGQSELDDYAQAVAEQQGRYIIPDPNPGAGSFFRSDHFNFAKIGIPALYAKGGHDSEEKGKEWAEEQNANYRANDYHQPTDEFDPSWDLEGIVQDVQLFFEIGKKIANEDNFPKWKEGSEFKAIREKSLGD